MCNASTSLTNTNYHFEVSNDGFEGAIDRMSQFFIAPAFSDDSVDREVNAINSEFNQALQVDGWHQFNMEMKVSNPKSNFNRFMCGNLKSL